MRASVDVGRLRQGALGGMLLLPGALVAYLGFSSGGFYPGATGLAVGIVAVVLALRVTVSADPLGGLGGASRAVACALGLFVLLMLVSAVWSDSSARAQIEFDRALLYLLTFVLMASVAGTRRRLRLALGAVAAGLLVVSLAGFLSRTLPEQFPAAAGLAASRLSHPVDYWNALGLMAAMGVLLCIHLSADRQGPATLRVLAAAGVPVLAATLLLTFSRGAIAAGAIGLVVYLALARTWGAVTALVAAAAGATPALVVAWRADLLASDDPTARAAMDQGRGLAAWVLVATVVAALARLALLAADRRLERLRLPPRVRRYKGAAIAVAASLAIVVAILAGLPGELGQQYERFTEGNTLPQVTAQRERLTEVGNNGRIEHWKVAVDAFQERPLLGHGAGTFALLWAADRPRLFDALDAHSLFAETAAELGVVGLVLLLTALLGALGALVVRSQRAPRGPVAAVAALFVLWLAHAGIDWDWEVSAATLPVFALAGTALARPLEMGRLREPGRTLRLAVALGCLALSVAPLQMALSQSALNQSVRAFKKGDCPEAIDASLRSARALGNRPEPFQMLSFCDARLGLSPLAVRMAQQAVAKDPDNWEFEYSLALVRAAGGRDPRPALARARRLNPEQPLVRRAARAFRSGGPESWKRRALRAPLPLGD